MHRVQHDHALAGLGLVILEIPGVLVAAPNPERCLHSFSLRPFGQALKYRRFQQEREVRTCRPAYWSSLESVGQSPSAALRNSRKRAIKKDQRAMSTKQVACSLHARAIRQTWQSGATELLKQSARVGKCGAVALGCHLQDSLKCAINENHWAIRTKQDAYS